MIVSHSRQFVFVHIPKTGGTSVETILAPHLVPGRDIHVSRASRLALPGDAHPGHLQDGKHVAANRLRRRLGAPRFDGYFSFAFSRNPYARTYSAWRFLQAKLAMDDRRRAKGQPARTSLNGKTPDLGGFREMPFAEVCAKLPRLAKRHSIFLPQCAWLPMPGSVNFVGRLENLAEDLAQIADRLGIDADALADLPTANQKTGHEEWRGMSAESAQAIRRFYAKDFDRFGYGTDFDGPDGAAPRAIRPIDPVEPLLARISGFTRRAMHWRPGR